MPLGIGLGISPTLATGVGGGADPALEAFADGTDGFYFDFSKTDRLFQGTGAVSDEAGENIATALDSHAWAGGSYPPSTLIAAQPELVSNGGFGSGTTGWAGARANEALSAPGGRLRMTANAAGAYGASTQITGLTVGKAYRIAGTIYHGPGATDAGFRLHITQSSLSTGVTTVSAAGGNRSFDYVWVATATSTYIGLIGVAVGSGDYLEVDDVSLKEIPGYHGLQATTAAQPKWQTGGLARFDGSDDNLLTTLAPGASGNTLMTKIKAPATLAATQIVMGAADDASTRLQLMVNTSGQLCAGVGADGSTAIVGTTDIRGLTGVAALVESAAGVSLYWNNSLQATKARNGAPTTTRAMALGAGNGGTGIANFAAVDVYHALTIRKALTAAQIAAITNKWGTS